MAAKKPFEALRRRAANLMKRVRRRFDDLRSEPSVHSDPPIIRPAGAALRAIGYVRKQGADVRLPPVRLIAFYAPELHSVPAEEPLTSTGAAWSLVAGAVPRLEGHDQPRLPDELGFYDACDAITLARQIDLARTYGVEAFAFCMAIGADTARAGGPLSHYLTDERLDFPFCVCWTMKGSSAPMGLDECARLAVTLIAKYLEHPAYVRVEGRPLLLLAWETTDADVRSVTTHIRDLYRDGNAAAPYLVLASRNAIKSEAIGADATLKLDSWEPAAPWVDTLADYVAVVPSWDDEPLHPGRGRRSARSSPRRFGETLAEAIRNSVRRSSDPSRRLVFVNAWNAWLQGAVLEPDERLGFAYLDATRRALTRVSDELNGRTAQGVANTSRRLCVVIHAYYPELLGEILPRLLEVSCKTRLIITAPASCTDEVRACMDRHPMEYECQVHENRGRDVLPFLRVANQLADDAEEVVLKLHTKRTHHRSDGERWRSELLAALLEPRNVNRIMDAFHDEPRVGVVAPEGHLLANRPFWGENAARVRYLCRRMAVSSDPGKCAFPAGSMFYARVAALRPLLDAHLGEWEFEPESGAADGTMAHAVERCIGISAVAAGFTVASSAAPTRHVQRGATEYPYAIRYTSEDRRSVR